MKNTGSLLTILFLVSGVAAYGQAPQDTTAPSTQPAPQTSTKHHGKSAAGEYGSGAGDAGKGAAGGVGHAAAGVGKGAGDVATLHPVKGAEAIGKGGAKGSEDVGKGAAKGTGKVVKGTGKVLTHPF